jgi:hypothetical protein
MLKDELLFVYTSGLHAVYQATQALDFIHLRKEWYDARPELIRVYGYQEEYEPFQPAYVYYGMGDFIHSLVQQGKLKEVYGDISVDLCCEEHTEYWTRRLDQVISSDFDKEFHKEVDAVANVPEEMLHTLKAERPWMYKDELTLEENIKRLTEFHRKNNHLI